VHLLREAIQECSGKVVVVYQLFDNNVFFETREDGSRSLPVKSSEDNKYHIVGRLDFADHGTNKNLVNIATPLFRAGGEAEKIKNAAKTRSILPIELSQNSPPQWGRRSLTCRTP
jgi:hypothetical protein